MTASDFSRYLQQPRLLYELPLAELQQLTLRFPYSPNLRLLLLLKAHLEGHPEEADYLARCAAATFDRSAVYDVLQELDVELADEEAAEGEFLELKELDDLELETGPAAPEQPAVFAEELPAPDVSPQEDRGQEDEDDEVAEMPFRGPAITGLTGNEETRDAPEGSEATDQKPERNPVDGGPAGRATTLTRYGTLQERLAKIRIRQETGRVDRQEDVNRIARRSLVAQEEVASETLAKLLVRQGQYQHAIKMYQRLILLYPEKKPTFAGLIKELKEKL